MFENKLSFEVPGVPIPQKRHRDRRPIKSKKTGRTFTPKYDPCKSDKVKFRAYCIRFKPKEIISTPIVCNLHFFFERPKSHYGTGRNSGILKKSAPIYFTTKPDIDNLIKFVFDALNDIFFTDDKIIIQVNSTKNYVENNEIPRTKIEFIY